MVNPPPWRHPRTPVSLGRGAPPVPRTSQPVRDAAVTWGIDVARKKKAWGRDKHPGPLSAEPFPSLPLPYRPPHSSLP